jgi:hypothetical protein
MLWTRATINEAWMRPLDPVWENLHGSGPPGAPRALPVFQTRLPLLFKKMPPSQSLTSNVAAKKIPASSRLGGVSFAHH